MHACRLLGTVNPGVAVSVADAARSFVGIGVEVGLADHHCAPDVDFRSEVDSTTETAIACLWVVILPFVIPWRFVFINYVKKRGDRWS
ncbi:hypothetical protein [Brevibacillus reuszeri]|uniref:hypothetical protein n=1 Tax=Brevibacillus reuszeri TaxID=54915 RepID=UPI00289ACE61|nr:hypothetical protein [Brevibacillus reuszeri]